MDRCPEIGRTGFECSLHAGHGGQHIAKVDGREVDRWGAVAPRKAKEEAKPDAG